MSIKGTKRKTTADFNAEHELFLELVREKCPELEIAVRLNLSKVQMNRHIIKALQEENVHPSDMIPKYEATCAKSLPMILRKLMSLESDNAGDALVRAEVQADGVLLSLLRAASSQQEQSITEAPQEAAMDSTEEGIV